MLTPTGVFREIAQKYGHVDPKDPKAVYRFFDETLKTLPTEEREQILEELLERDAQLEET